jgi:type IV secretory pathway VirB2 component (pilin)
MGGDKLASILQALITLLSSDVARLLFVAAIIGVGYAWLYAGRMPKGAAISAIIGIGIVFSAPWIAQQLGIGG